ncbi:MerR family transcriptional regulator [Halopolyspora algeriensis]|uniref:MerR family transcriptional regulator n=1 Tax=Halopolyspora algeriensis TaxID=1500506 RepID=UPI00211E1AF1|nr:MerR family transcriptional regulator [Halopolyspora algeriensis]
MPNCPDTLASAHGAGTAHPGRSPGDLQWRGEVRRTRWLARPIGAVAQRLGIAVSTLRSWGRRYGLGHTGHSPGRHRRYAAQDLQRLHRVISPTHDGVPPAAAARVALDTDSTPPPTRDGGGSGSVAAGRTATRTRPPRRTRSSSALLTSRKYEDRKCHGVGLPVDIFAEHSLGRRSRRFATIHDDSRRIDRIVW